MDNNQRLYNCFAAALSIPVEQVSDNLTYNAIKEWDSVAHMGLVAELEKVFEVMFDTDDIIDMNSVARAREILQKYGVSFS
jgi:acyl carrier protein